MQDTNEEQDSSVETILLEIEDIVRSVKDSWKTVRQIVPADSLELVQELDLAAYLSDVLIKEKIAQLVEKLQNHNLAFGAEVVIASP